MYKKTFLILIAFLSFVVFACNSDKKESSTETETTEDTTVNLVEELPRHDMAPAADSTEEAPAYYKILETGLKYHMVDYHPDQPYPNPGDIIYLSMDYFLNDSLLFSSSELPDTMKMRMYQPDMPGTIDEALFQMHQYDSAEFILDANKFYLHTRQLAQLPEFINLGDSLRFQVRLMKIIPAAKWDKMQEAEVQEKREFEASEIRKYLLDNGINANKSDNGIYREIKHKGSGSVVSDNSQVSIHYTGKFLDNSVFSSTYESQQPFTFGMGLNEVIPGLEYGLLDMSEGSTMVLIIPFDQAYKEQQRGPIPPWSTLVFEVQIISVR